MYEVVRCLSNLEEVDLNGAVTEVQDDGTFGPEPQGEVRQPRQLISVPSRHVGPRFQQVLAHVVAEVLQECYLQHKSFKHTFFYFNCIKPKHHLKKKKKSNLLLTFLLRAEGNERTLR